MPSCGLQFQLGAVDLPTIQEECGAGTGLVVVRLIRRREDTQQPLATSDQRYIPPEPLRGLVDMHGRDRQPHWYRTGRASRVIRERPQPRLEPPDARRARSTPVPSEVGQPGEFR